jgi:hypothetical protein
MDRAAVVVAVEKKLIQEHYTGLTAPKVSPRNDLG